MKRNPSAAFTLLEMMTVIAVIVILTGMVLSIAGYANRKGALARAEGELKMIETACESYKADNGSYPREIPASGSGSGSTDKLSPKQHFSPVSALYTNASLFLYMELSGDKTGTSGSGPPDFVPEVGEQRYFKELDPRVLNVKRDADKKIIQVNYLQDPFGFSYGYSTAAAAAEEGFQQKLKLGQTATRPSGNSMPGFTPGGFDIWSTAGTNTTKTVASDAAMGLEWAKWVKNW